MILPRKFYQQPTVAVARDLLGKRIVRVWNDTVLSGIITETEAYCGEIDPASHAYQGKNERNTAMFGPVGHSYVYLSYGVHFCLNLVSRQKPAKAGGVLIRGFIPYEGIDVMKKLRRTDNVSELANGPGKVGQALHLRLENNHIDITQEGELYVTDGVELKKNDIIATPRIGITKAHDRLWRFIIKEDVYDRIKKSL